MNKIFHQYNRKVWVIFLITLIIGIIIFPRLPESIPVHFNSVGEVDRYGSRWYIFLTPCINFIIILLAEGLRKLDLKSDVYQKFESQYYNIMFFVALLMWSIQLLTIAYVFGYEINIARVMPFIMGVMFIFLGNIMPKFKHNYFVGIKTSWTLASEKVWYLTHRFTGVIWVVGGIIILFSAFLPVEMIAWVFFAIIIVLVVIPFGASYYFYRETEDK